MGRSGEGTKAQRREQRRWPSQNTSSEFAEGSRRGCDGATLVLGAGPNHPASR